MTNERTHVDKSQAQAAYSAAGFETRVVSLTELASLATLVGGFDDDSVIMEVTRSESA